jgi:REP element-mobilizing transposase RayT
MAKNHEEMASDILSSLRIPNAPEKVLVEAYLEAMIKQHKREAVQEYINNQNIENMGK